MFFGVSPLQSAHVLVSLFAIAIGLWVLFGLITARRMPVATVLFLATTLITTLSGFLLPIKGFTPAVGTGIVSTLVLAVTLWARYGAKMQGRWRGAYVVGAVISLYLNVFVLVAQLFLKVPALKALAPTGTEPAFGVAQLVTLALFVGAGVLAWKRFRL
jgi:hypothetical protein